MWGPRFYLFLNESDMPLKRDIEDAFGRGFPYTYKGCSVNFSAPAPGGNGMRYPESITEGPVSPLVFIHTPDGYINEYLGTSELDGLTALDWISFSEHRLLSLTSGKIFRDELNMRKTLDKLKYYPEDVRLYLIASNWSLIAEEQAFVRRCFDVGDDLGSSLVCGRIADRLMRLAFLYCGQYAPYSKWFGTAFSKLPVGEAIKNAVYRAVTASDIKTREDSITAAQLLTAELHNNSGLTEYVGVKIESYYERDIKVIFGEKIASAAMKKLAGTDFEKYPPIGTLSGVANFVGISDDLARRERVKLLYG